DSRQYNHVQLRVLDRYLPATSRRSLAEARSHGIFYLFIYYWYPHSTVCVDWTPSFIIILKLVLAYCQSLLPIQLPFFPSSWPCTSSSRAAARTYNRFLSCLPATPDPDSFLLVLRPVIHPSISRV